MKSTSLTVAILPARQAWSARWCWRATSRPRCSERAKERGLRWGALTTLLILVLAALAVPPRPARSAEGNALTLLVGDLIVPVLGRDRVVAQATVQVAVWLEDRDLLKSVMARLPRLRDAFFTRLYRLGADGQLGAAGLDLDQLKRLFQKAADRIVGRDTVEVLILQAHFSRLSKKPRSRKQGKPGPAPPSPAG